MEKQMTQPQENKMGVMPVLPLLVSMSVPIMISMLVQALYNVVDSVFVSRISESALTAVSLAFPAQNLMIAVATGTGVGVNALLSRSLGEKNFERANSAASHAVVLSIISFAVFALLGTFFSKAFMLSQTTIPEIVEHGTVYLQICLIFSFGLFMQITFERLLQSTGKTFYTMLTQCLGAIINIVLDPILIFGLVGFPKMGVAGAAVATVTGQIIAFIVSAIVNHLKNDEIKLKLKGFRLNKRIVGTIYSVGLPSIIMASIGSVMTFGLNKILIAFSSTATAVFGVYFKLQSFVFMPVFGMNNGMVPIIAYNYGAKRPERITQTVKLSICGATMIMALGVLLFQLCPEWLLKLFDASDYMLGIGVPALRIISIHFILAGFAIVCSSTFQALGHGMLSLIMSVLRQLVVLLPVAYLLSLQFGLDAVWWAFPIAELVSMTFCAVMLYRVYQKEIKPIAAK